MTNPKDAALPRVTVVRIGTGTKHEAAIVPGYLGAQVWFVESLRKDGQTPGNRYSDGSLVNGQYVYLSSFALIDANRETRADLVRARIAGLREQVTLAEQELCALYRDSGQNAL